MQHLNQTFWKSSSLAAMANLEEYWKENLTEGKAKKLVHYAIAAGTINDMGSSLIQVIMLITSDLMRNWLLKDSVVKTTIGLEN